MFKQYKQPTSENVAEFKSRLAESNKQDAKRVLSVVLAVLVGCILFTACSWIVVVAISWQ